MSRNGLYALVLGLSFAGYAWLSLNAFLFTERTTDSYTVCLVKNATGVPCPACGTTRSMLAIFNGNLAESVDHNPLGLLMMVLIFVFPAWIISDLIRRKNHFHSFYNKVERAFERKIIMIPSVLVIIAIWAWSVYKDL
jgi:Protein of unknown function (DUF2752)